MRLRANFKEPTALDDWLALPVTGLAALMASGMIHIGQVVKRFKAADVWIQRVVGIVFVLIGLNETALDWLL